MRRIELLFNPPVESTEDELREWVEYCLGITGMLSMNNPLSEHDLEGDDVTIY